MGEVERVNPTFSASLANTNHHRVGQPPHRNPRKHQDQHSQDDVLELHTEPEEEATIKPILQVDSSEELDLSA